MTKLIIDFKEDGELYVYFESEAHFKKMGRNKEELLNPRDLLNECFVPRGSCIVINNVKIPPK